MTGTVGAAGARLAPRLPLPARGGIVVRLIGLVVVVALAAGGIATWAIIQSSRSTLREEIGVRSTAIAQGLAVRLDGRLDAAAETLRVIATRDPLVTLQPAAQSDLRVALDSAGLFDELVLYDAAGEVVAAAASRALADPDAYPAQPGIVATTAAASASRSNDLRMVQRFPPLAELAVPVEFPPGRPVGALVGRVPLEELAEPVLALDSSTEALSYLVDADGDVVVHPERDRMVRGERVRLPADLTTWDILDVAGERSLVAVASTRLLDGRVVLQQPERQALAPLGDRTRDLFAIVAAVLVPALAVILIGGTLLLRPLRPLSRAVAQLGRGERGVRVATSGRGEVADLAGEFNRLADALDRREDEIDQLQRLSLLVSAGGHHDALLDVVTTGATRLLTADGCAYYDVPPGRHPVIADATGEPAGDHVAEVVTAAHRANQLRAEAAGLHAALAVPVARLDGTVLGVLAAHRRGPAFTRREEELARAFAAFAGVALDNVRRLELEQQLAAELQDAVDRRRDLISRITHEFRTPLMCVSGFSTALTERWSAYDDAQRRSLIDKIRLHAEELDELVSGLLDFSVTERATVRVQIGQVNLREAVDAAVEGLRPVLGDRPVAIDVEPVAVAADSSLIRRTLNNLLSNAAKYSPPESPLRIRSVADGGHARVEVIDRGVGMTAEEASQAFSPFWRSGSPNVRATRGAGLGLALVAEYVRLMGGGTGVVSEPGRGSTFFFTVPLAASTADARAVG